MTTATTTFISKLSDIPDYKAWINRSLWRVVQAASSIITPTVGADGTIVPFSMSDMAVGVFDEPDSEACLHRKLCPVDATGQHARDFMTPYLVGEFVGQFGRTRVVDGLSPEDIRFLKAHTAARTHQSNRDTIVTDNYLRDGDTRSYGAVSVVVRIGGSPHTWFSFIVASSGGKAWQDHQLSAIAGEVVVGDAISDGYLPPFSVASPTFIIGADPAQVAAHADRPLPQKEDAK